MKKYLNKVKPKRFLLILTFLLASVFLRTFAENKTEYYKRLFGEEFGFTVYEPDREKSNDTNYLSSNLEEAYGIILSSDLKIGEAEVGVKVANYLRTYKRAILICDVEFSDDYPFEFSCDDNKITSDAGLSLEKFVRSYEDSEIDIYIIPENALLTRDGRSEIKEYFTAIKRSDETVGVTEDSEIEEESVGIISQIKLFKDTLVFEFFSIAFSMFIIASISWRFLKYLTEKDRAGYREFIRNVPNILSGISIYQKVVLSVLGIMVLIYLPLILSISIKDGMGFDIGYIVSYTLENIDVAKLVEFSHTESFFRIVLFFYEMVFGILLLSLFIPVFFRVFNRAREKVSEASIRSIIYKYSFPSLILFSLAGSSFFEITESVKFLIFILVVLVFLSVKNFFDRDFDYRYSSKEKIIFLAMGLIILGGGFLFEVRESRVEPKYRTEDLIGVTDEVVLLPYSKQLGKNTLINEYNFSGPEPVFVDHYLVYSPINSRIENKSALDFKNEGSFYIQNGEVSDIVYAIESNKELFSIMVSEYPTNFFRLPAIQENIVSEEKTEIEITFSCLREGLGEDKIEVDYYYLGESGEVEEDDETLLYFPGCSEVGEPENIRVEFYTPYLESDHFYVRLKNLLPSDIEGILVYYSDMVIEPVYLSKNRGYTIIDSGGLTTSAIVPVTNYIFGDAYDLSFDIALEEEAFDMSGPINELIKEGVLEDRFLIWSTRKYLPVRLPD